MSKEKMDELKREREAQGSIAFCWFLSQCLLLFLKLMNAVDLSWEWVFTPTWLFCIIFSSISAILMINRGKN